MLTKELLWPCRIPFCQLPKTLSGGAFGPDAGRPVEEIQDNSTVHQEKGSGRWGAAARYYQEKGG